VRVGVDVPVGVNVGVGVRVEVEVGEAVRVVVGGRGVRVAVKVGGTNEAVGVNETRGGMVGVGVGCRLGAKTTATSPIQ